MHTDVSIIINSAKSSNFYQQFLLGTLPKVLSFEVTSGILEGCSDIVKVVAEDYALEITKLSSDFNSNSSLKLTELS